MAAIYTCPTCGERMERDLSLFMEHTDKHIIDEVKRLHPNWITEDGFCQKCLDYYKSAGTLETTNLDAEGIKQRVALGFLGFGGGFGWWYWFQVTDAPRMGRLALFPLFLAGALGAFQARKKLCVIIAQKQSETMRRRALKLLACSILVAAVLTAVSFIDIL